MGLFGQEKDILNHAILAFQKETGLEVIVRDGYTIARQDDTDMTEFPRMRFDGQLVFRVDNREIRYLVEVKTKIDNIVITKLIQRVNLTDENWLLATRYVPPDLARELKRMGIQFMDTAGNAYIRHKPLMIYIAGNRAKTEKTQYKNHAFAWAGTIVTFALLCDKDLVNAPFREIAARAGVALGTVAGVIEDLKRMQFLIETKNHKRKLLQKEKLLEEWVRAFNEKQQQKLLIGRYEAPDNTIWQTKKPNTADVWWGGEVAAYHLTEYLIPEIVTIYTCNIHNTVNRMVAANKLKKAPLRSNRNIVEIKEKFWNFEWNTQEAGIAPLLLVYADLLATDDTRNIETAVKIYDEYLLQQLG